MNRWLSRLKNSLVNPATPTLALDIKFKHADQLLNLQKNNKYGESVPAKLRVGNENVPIDISVKETPNKEQSLAKMAFEVELDEAKAYEGMRQFSLYPLSKQFDLQRWYFYEHLREEGLLAPRLQAVNLSINGELKGTYALEQAVDRFLIESQRRREGVLFNLFTNNGTTVKKTNEDFVPLQGTLQPYFLSLTTSRQPKHESESQRIRYQTALSRALSAFGSQSLAPKKLFDPKELGRFLAIGQLWLGNEHCCANSMSLYFNPITYRFEPILSTGLNRDSLKPFLHWAISDVEVFRAYAGSIEKMAEGGAVLTLLDELQRRACPYEMALRENAIAPNPLIRKENNERAEKLLEQISPKVIARAFSQIEKGTVVVDVENVTHLPIEVHAFYLGSQKPKNKRISVSRFREGSHPDNPAILVAKNNETPLARFRFPSKYTKQYEKRRAVWVEVSVLGTSRRLSVPAISTRLSPLDRQAVMIPNPTPKEEFKKKYSKFVREENGAFVLGPGVLSIDEYVVSPRESLVRIEPATTIEFGKNAGLLVHGRLFAQGTKKRPITLKAKDKQWLGVFVFGGDQSSQLSHTRITSATVPSFGGWEPTGAVTFYRSKVKMNNVRFQNSNAEDQLNLFRSQFEITHSSFSDTLSDSIDSDFSNGKLAHCRFERIQGDAIDLSGSEVTIENVFANKVSDKVLSGGEASSVQAQKMQVHNSRMGLVSKDRSRVRVSDSSIVGNTVGIASFQKKPEYGGGWIEAERIELMKNEKDVFVQTGSYARVNGNRIEETNFETSSLYQ